MTGRMSGHPGSYNGGGSAIVRRMTIRGRGARRPWHWLLLIALLLASGGAMALGLGQIRVLSAPGEPFLAEIPIISNEPGELENARARLASSDTFARVGLQPPTGLVRDLQFEITTDAQDRAVVRVTGSVPVDVAALAFLVEVDWGQGRLVREYSALVDAPRTTAPIDAPVIQAPRALPSDSIVRAPQPVVAPAEPAPAAEPATAAPPVAQAPARPRPTPAASVAPGEELGRVQRGQTLSQLAAGMDRGGRSLDEAMVALLRANPQAFIGGNIHRLRAGAQLRMPGAEDFGQADAAAASALVREQTAQWRQATRPALQPADAGVAATNPAPAAVPAIAPAPAPTGARLEIAPAAAAAGSQATDSGLDAGGEGDMLANEQLRQAREDLATRDTELQELRSRLDDLEKLQQQQARLIELKDSELASAQQALATSNAASAPAAMPAWLWPGLALALVVAGLVGWWARRPRPSPIPAADRNGGSGRGFDAAALAAAMPQQAQDPQANVESGDGDQADTRVEREDVLAWSAATGAAATAAPAWHTGEVAQDAAIDLAPINPAPAGRERLELAIAYLDLGDLETARSLLQEVAAGQDPVARDEALLLLREIG